MNKSSNIISINNLYLWPSPSRLIRRCLGWLGRSWARIESVWWTWKQAKYVQRVAWSFSVCFRPCLEHPRKVIGLPRAIRREQEEERQWVQDFSAGTGDPIELSMRRSGEGKIVIFVTCCTIKGFDEPHLKYDNEEQKSTCNLNAKTSEHHHNTTNLSAQVDKNKACREEFPAIPGHVHVFSLLIPSIHQKHFSFQHNIWTI